MTDLQFNLVLAIAARIGAPEIDALVQAAKAERDFQSKAGFIYGSHEEPSSIAETLG